MRLGYDTIDVGATFSWSRSRGNLEGGNTDHTILESVEVQDRNIRNKRNENSAWSVSIIAQR